MVDYASRVAEISTELMVLFANKLIRTNYLWFLHLDLAYIILSKGCDCICYVFQSDTSSVDCADV